MDKAITTAFLIIISIILVMLLFNVTYPAVIDGTDAIVNVASNESDRIRSRIDVIHVASELDATSNWSDTNGNGDFDVTVWIKNIGSTRIIALDSMDIFFGEDGNFRRIPHESKAGTTYPRWSWSLEDASEWLPTTTLRIQIQYSGALSSGLYFFKAVTPVGVQDEFFTGL